MKNKDILMTIIAFSLFLIPIGVLGYCIGTKKWLGALICVLIFNGLIIILISVAKGVENEEL